MMEELQVYYEKKRVGALRRDDDLVYSFSYESSWIEDKESIRCLLLSGMIDKQIVLEKFIASINKIFVRPKD